MKILKFGGTSVGKPERMHQVATIVTSDNSQKIVVLSALSGTTNALVTIGDLLSRKKIKEAEATIDELYKHYLDFYPKLVSKPEYKKKARSIIDEHFEFIKGLLYRSFNAKYNKELLAQGELMSTKMFLQYLLEKDIKAAMLPALEFMVINELEEPDISHIKSKIDDLLKQNSGYDIYITQGYICLNALNEIDNLKRGGSDYTATLIGATIEAEVVQIWTDIDGMHNNDPRIVDHTFPIAELSFNEASELAYFGAKILHPSSILPVLQYNVPVQLKNTMEPDAHGTLISSVEKTKQVKAIAAKDNITAIKIKSTRMLLAYGFLTKVFEIFEKYKAPIDMITTSEVAVSLTIDNDEFLKEITGDLKLFGQVTVDKNQTIICIVGNQIAEQKGLVKKIFESLEHVPIRMISYGGSKYNVSLLIDSNYKKEALKSLNKGLFNL